MIYSILADLLVLFHFAFVLFVLFGGFLLLKYKQLIFLHVPAFLWGIVVELNHWICPLTPMEKHFREKAGEAGYDGGFVENYLIPVLYPAGLTEDIQTVLGLVVLFLNLGVYFVVFRKRRP